MNQIAGDSVADVEGVVAERVALHGPQMEFATKLCVNFKPSRAIASIFGVELIFEP